MHSTEIVVMRFQSVDVGACGVLFQWNGLVLSSITARQAAAEIISQ
jgi:hypothetical protein